MRGREARSTGERAAPGRGGGEEPPATRRPDGEGAPEAGSMTWGALVREVWRDIATGTARAGVLSALFALLVCGPALVDCAQVVGIGAQAARFRASLASVRVFEAKGAIDGAACHALGRIPGVRAAAVRTAETGVRAAALPASSIPLYEATPGIGAIVRAPGAPTTGVLASEQVAAALGLHPGSALALAAGDAEVAGVYPWDEGDGRRPGFAYAVISPVLAQGVFDECWVESWPMSAAIPPLARTAVIPDGEPEVKEGAFNASLGASFDGDALLRGRLTRWAPLVSAVLGALVGAGGVWARRLEIASALHAGLSRADALLIQTCEALAWTASGTVMALPAATIVIAGAQSPEAPGVWAIVFLEAGAGLLAALLGAVAATCLVREKRLFAYFKRRR